jgi:dipeptidyl aminopeptidase/acylaminoacyl peptidase
VTGPVLELTAELLADAAEVQDPAISPDGHLVAYVVSTRSGNRNRLRALWVAPADASAPPRELVPSLGLAGAPRWAPDSASLVVIAERRTAGRPLLGFSRGSGRQLHERRVLALECLGHAAAPAVGNRARHGVGEDVLLPVFDGVEDGPGH